QPLEDRAAKHQGLQRGLVALEHFVDEEVDDVATGTAEPAHERVPVLGTAKRQRSEIQPGRPALGPFDELIDVIARQPEVETIVEEKIRLGGAEPELLGAQLEQLSMGA